jgi:hypothetical protein
MAVAGVKAPLEFREDVDEHGESDGVALIMLFVKLLEDTLVFTFRSVLSFVMILLFTFLSKILVSGFLFNTFLLLSVVECMFTE